MYEWNDDGPSPLAQANHAFSCSCSPWPPGDGSWFDRG